MSHSSAPPAFPSHRSRNLALVQPRGFGDALPEPPRPALRRWRDQLPRIPCPERGARGLPAEEMRRATRRPRGAVHAQQPAVRDRLLRHPARRRRSRPINCMNTTGELEQILRDAGATTIVTAQELQPRVEPLARNEERCARRFHIASSPATRTTLAMKRRRCCPRRWPRRACNSGSRRSLIGTKCSSRHTHRHRTRPGPTILR